ncbi:MAG: hypothetical protein KQH53_08435 [Desulfarculaceae bacterium]|nr:hypothetical protein [Desulfarculaceae bacterium]
MQQATALDPAQYRPLPPLKGTMERGLWRALHCQAGSLQRWDARRQYGLDNRQLKEVVSQEFGRFAGLAGPDIECIAWRGGDDPAFWWGGKDPVKPPTLRGAELIKRAREILDIPWPIATRH